MDMKKLYEDFSSHINQLSDAEIRESINKAINEVEKMRLSLDEVKEIVRRMENSGATHIVFDYDVNCDTAEIERLSIDEFDNSLYLDTLYTLYND